MCVSSTHPPHLKRVGFQLASRGMLPGINCHATSVLSSENCLLHAKKRRCLVLEWTVHALVGWLAHINREAPLKTPLPGIVIAWWLFRLPRHFHIAGHAGLTTFARALQALLLHSNQKPQNNLILNSPPFSFPKIETALCMASNSQHDVSSREGNSQFNVPGMQVFHATPPATQASWFKFCTIDLSFVDKGVWKWFYFFTDFHGLKGRK